MKVAIDVVLANKLTTNVPGKLIALYEYAFLLQRTVWRINSFDQWGVKLGKVPAKRILPEPTARYCGMKGN
jgi:glucose-6-phosphate isomerase